MNTTAELETWLATCQTGKAAPMTVLMYEPSKEIARHLAYWHAQLIKAQIRALNLADGHHCDPYLWRKSRENTA